MIYKIPEIGAGIQSFFRELHQELAQEVSRKIEEQLDQEVNAWLYRHWYERRQGVKRRSQAYCQKCGSQKACQFLRNGYRARQVVTQFGVINFRLPRVRCVCGGSVQIPFLIMKDRITDLSIIQQEQIRRFIARNLHRRHEPFFETYPERLRGKLSTSDFMVFKKAWEDVSSKGLSITNDIPEFTVKAMYGYISVRLDNGTEVEFKLMAETVLYFFGNLFELVRYYPVSDDDRHKADAVFNQYHTVDSNKLKLWNLRDLDEVLTGFEG